MNWDAIGAIGDIIGAIAVVVSLIYVAIQVRDNSNQTKASMATTTTDAFNRMQEVLISNPDVIELFTKMKTRNDLSATEDMLLEAVANRYLAHWWSIQSAYDRNVIDEEFFETFTEDVTRYVNAYPQMHKKFLEIMSLYTRPKDNAIFASIFAAGSTTHDNDGDSISPD